MKLRYLIAAVALLASALLVSCSSASYVTSELSGGAKPEGGIKEVIPATKTFAPSAAAVREAVLAVLQDQGYIAEENKSTGTIRTELKPLPNSGGSIMVAYSVRVFITLDASTVTYRARFDKKSSVVQAEANLEFPEKENELRKEFFAAVDRKLPK